VFSTLRIVGKQPYYSSRSSFDDQDPTMQKLCLYCWQNLSFEQSVQGRLFCSPEHRECYLQGLMLPNFEAPAPEGQQLAGRVSFQPFLERRARNIEVASRILQSLESRKVELPSMPPASVRQPRLEPAAPAEPRGNQPVLETKASDPVHALLASAEEPKTGPRPAQLDPIVRFAARVGGFGPFRPQSSIRPWAIAAIAAGLILAAVLWTPNWTGTRVSAAERLKIATPAARPHETGWVPACSGAQGASKNTRLVIDGHAMPAREMAQGDSLGDCGDREIAFNLLRLE
jgi:hypothetical protein